MDHVVTCVNMKHFSRLSYNMITTMKLTTILNHKLRICNCEPQQIAYFFPFRCPNVLFLGILAVDIWRVDDGSWIPFTPSI